MAHFEFRLPDIGEGVSEGEIVAWHGRHPRQGVEEDQPMVDVMTDKATVTIGAPRAGTIAQSCASKVGEIVPGGVRPGRDRSRKATRPEASAQKRDREERGAPRRATWETSATATGRIERHPQQEASRTVRTASSRTTAMARAGPRARSVRGRERCLRASPAADYFNEKPLATPATRKLARELEVDLRVVWRPAATRAAASPRTMCAPITRGISAPAADSRAHRGFGRRPPSLPRLSSADRDRGPERRARRASRSASSPSWASAARSPSGCRPPRTPPRTSPSSRSATCGRLKELRARLKGRRRRGRGRQALLPALHGQSRRRGAQGIGRSLNSRSG